MRTLLPYLAALMVYAMTPGAGELTENAVHLIVDGHTAHAFDDAEHEPKGDEHGCSGSFHVCQCHTSPGFVIGPDNGRVEAQLPTLERLQWSADDAQAEGHLPGVFRPPIA